MSFATVVSVGSLDFHGVWDDKWRLPHGAMVTRRSRWLSAGWGKFLYLFGFCEFRVFLLG